MKEKSTKELLDMLLSRLNIDEQGPLATVHREWMEIVGPDIAVHAKILDIGEGADHRIGPPHVVLDDPHAEEADHRKDRPPIPGVGYFTNPGPGTERLASIAGNMPIVFFGHSASDAAG
jgi:hypothetical protein